MGILVHPKFDDEHELANGVATLQIVPPGTPGAGEVRYRALVNVQQGAESVTNAESGVTPEAIELWSREDGKVEQRRLAQASTEAGSLARTALNERQLISLMGELINVGESWLLQENRGRPKEVQRRGGVLDFEFRTMGPLWPARRDGQQGSGSRTFLKQVRPLEPAPRGVATRLEAAPIPAELFSRAARAEVSVCEAEGLSVQLTLLWTRRGSAHDFGYADRPFVAEAILRSKGLPQSAPETRLLHFDLASFSGEVPAGTRWAFSIRKPGAPFLGMFLDGQALGFVDSSKNRSSMLVRCTSDVLLDDPDRLLRDALGVRAERR